MKFKDEIKSIKEIKAHIEASKKLWNTWYTKPLDNNLNFLEEKINNKEYKGVVIYAEAVLWEPVQRPHHFLRELGKKGYLCFFLVHEDTQEVKIEEKYPNVYLVNGQEKVLPLLKDKEVTFLITYFMQYVYSSQYSNKKIWLDVLDRLDFFSHYNRYTKKIWKKLMKDADVVTYSADNLKSFISKKKEAILLPNAANIDDFKITKEVIPNDLKDILKSKKKIIGYYGAIENWFDFSIIEKLSQLEEYEIVLIGRYSIKKEYPRVHYLGQKDYKDLKNYAMHFDVALIPFIVNDVTNNVSPVKFFEYLALNLPVLSTPIHEMKAYEGTTVKLITSLDHIETQLKELVELEKDVIKKESEAILLENTWKKRVEKVEKLITGR